MKIIVCSRISSNDIYLIDHFIKYYLNLKVDHFFINFNSKIPDDNLEKIINYVSNKYSEYITFNIGPNGDGIIEINEESNINMLKKLVDKNLSIGDYVIPADSDEFHEYPKDLHEMIQKLDKIDYLYGNTNERISENGDIIPIQENIDIFKQFPKWNNNLFCCPKISLIKAEHFNKTGVGHHYINNKYNLNGDRCTVTNHFRWNLQGKKRIERWIEIFSSNKYIGWSDIDKYKKMLDVFNTNLLNY
jgi:hypothetical protein